MDQQQAVRFLGDAAGVWLYSRGRAGWCVLSWSLAGSSSQRLWSRTISRRAGCRAASGDGWHGVARRRIAMLEWGKFARQLFNLLNVPELGIRTEGTPKFRPHFKGGYTSHGKVYVANNSCDNSDFQGESADSLLAEWDGQHWRVLRRAAFNEVTGRYGLVIATGWDSAPVRFRNAIYYEALKPELGSWPLVAVRTERWKYICTYRTEPGPRETVFKELYDRAKDPRELNNLAEDPDRQASLKELRRLRNDLRP